MDFQGHYRTYKELVDRRLRESVERHEPRSLYDPVRYVLEGGGKRVRGVFVMLAAESVGGDGVGALDAGVAVEIMHDFTLVHDDIMDRSSTRRGRATVHLKWDEATAILGGDVMIGLAYTAALRGRYARTADVLAALTRGLVDVCEGQALDKEYETRNDVLLDDYMYMIAMKTGRLLETAAEVGGLVGGGTPEQIDALRACARHLGHAFQIQDDLLDIVADEAEFGKRIGGDVIEGKRTYLLVQALQRVVDGDDRRLLDRLLEERGLPQEDVSRMRELYDRNGILQAARDDVRLHVERAQERLNDLPDTPARAMLGWFSTMLMNRNS
jgi:geranylgeranyl diphosphate synthase type II